MSDSSHGLRVDVRHDLNEIALFYGGMAEGIRDKATVRALNRTATTVRAEAARKINAVYAMKIGDIKDRIQIINATRGQLKAVVRARGGVMSLSGFNPRQNNSGVMVTVKRGGRKLIRHAFLLQKPGGSPVFERVGKARLPIKKLFTLSLPQAFTNEQVLDALKEVAAKRFAEAFRQEARFYMRKG